MSFEHPDPWHAPAAYWFWHYRPGEAQIREQVGQMQAAGIQSFQVQARMAYPIEDYLSEEYLAACRIAVDEASRRGMMVGVYDDYNWQTGHAAGRAVAGHDHLRERQLFWASGVVSGDELELKISDIHSSTESLGAPGMAWHYENSEVRWADWNVEFAVADGVRDITSAASLVAASEDGCSMRVAGIPDGTAVTVFVSARCATSRLVNFMDDAAAARFIEAGYQPFADALGDFFGSTITYFFFDQPHANYYRWEQHHGNLASAMPFHSTLGDDVRTRWPEIWPAVLSSLLDAGDAAQLALRAQFYEFFSERSQRTFLGAMHDWTAAHGVALSGHEVLAHVGKWDLAGAFDNWDLRVNFGVDYFGIDSYRDLTGVDAQDSVPQLSAKLGDSVARSNGRSGTIVEQYYARAHTGSGTYAGHWGLTLEEMRAQALRHHILGMRQFLFHGFYQSHGADDDPTMFSNPRFDFPPGVNFEPWFERYHDAFAQDSGRLSEFLDRMEPVCEVAVLYPLRTVWTEGQGGPQAQDGGAWYEALARDGYGYHLIDERDLLTSVAHGGLRIGDRVYRALVLPGVRTLRSAESVAKIAELARAGVTVVTTGQTPAIYQEGEQTAAADWAAVAGVRAFPDFDAVGPLETLLGIPGGGVVTVEADGGRPWWRAGRVGDDIRVALFNDGTEPIRVQVSGTDHPHVQEWVTSDGSRRAAGRDLVLEPMALKLLVFTTEPADGGAGRAGDVTWAAAVELPDGWRLEVPADAHAHAGTSHEVHTRAGWEQQGLEAYSGIARYVRAVDLPGDLDAELELPAVSGAVTVRLNGAEAGSLGWRPFRFRLGAADQHPGPNELVIEVASSAANRYYAGTGMRDAPEPAGLLAPPLLRLNTRNSEDR